MAGFETYTSRAPAPGPQALPQLDDRSATAAATVRAGGVVAGFGEQLRAAQGAAQKARATTTYLEGSAQLDKKYENDADPATAAKRYADDELKLREDTLGTVADATEREQLRTQLTRYGVANQAQASGIFLKRQADGFSADLDAQQNGVVSRAGRAGSPVERQAVTEGYFSQVDDGARKGWITQQQAQARKAGVARTLDDGDAQKLITENPQAALAALNDPTKFGTLTPEIRQARQQQAQAKANALGVQEYAIAAKAEPVRALAMLGRVTSPDQIPGAATHIINKALFPQESSSNPNTPDSKKGAAGIGQFMPDTARAVARQIGRTELDGLNDEGVRQVLRSNPDLGRQLATRHVSDFLVRYGGRFGPTFVGYHAGQGRADQLHKAAIERFGEGYTPAQFTSIIPDSLTDGDKKTKDYVSDLFGRLGADPGRTPQLDQAGTYQALSAVNTAMNAEAAGRKQAIIQQASLAGEEADSIAALLKDGYAQDPALIARIKQPLIQAAALGNAEAARKLRNVEFHEAIAPQMRVAHAMAPDRLEAQVTAEEARLATSGHVTQQERDRLEIMKSVLNTKRTEAGNDPIGLMARQGMAVQPLPPELLSPEMPAALALRGQQALEANETYRGGVKPFRPAETQAFKSAFDQANADERFRFASEAARSMPDAAYEAAMGQLGADKMTIIAGRLSTYDQALGQKVARGAALLKQKGVDDGKAADLTSALKSKLGRSVYPPLVEAEMVDAALAVYVADRDGKGSLYDPSDQKGLEAALEAVTGKLVTVNGVKVPLPPGATAGQFEDARSLLSLRDIGGVAKGADGKDIDLDFIRSHGILKPEGYRTGRYRVLTPGGSDGKAVLGADGKALVIDIMPLMQRVVSREPSASLTEGMRAIWWNAAERDARALTEARRELAEAEGNLASLSEPARVPSPTSPLGRTAVERTRARLEAARAEVLRLEGRKP